MSVPAPDVCPECGKLAGRVIASDRLLDAEDLPPPKHRRKADLALAKTLGSGCRLRRLKCTDCGARWGTVEVQLALLEQGCALRLTHAQAQTLEALETLRNLLTLEST